jgi:dihydrolipoamide dehydrogenase
MSETYDLAVLGAGSGGYVAAIRAAQLGLSVALVEKRDALGGTCLNVGCIPSKSLLESTGLYAAAKDSLKSHGILVGKLELDLAAMMQRKEAVVSRLTSGVDHLMKSRGVEVISGEGRFLSAEKLLVRGQKGKDLEVRARSFLLATGSAPAELPVLPFDGGRIVSSTEALSFAEVPKRLLVVGAGAIGLEMGSVWSRLGSEVTIIEILPRILSGWDTRLAESLKRELSKQGIRFELSTKVTGWKAAGKGITLKAETGDGSPAEYAGDVVLAAVGRKPYVDGSGIQELGVEREGPAVRVDGSFRTSVPNLYAVGDVIPGPMLAHTAEEEGIAAAEILAGKPGNVDYDVIPNVVYTHPEAASVGRSEDQLKDEGVGYRMGSFPFRANGRALALGETQGWVKILADEKTDRILGIHILGPQASNLISEAVTVMVYGGSAEDLARTVHAHPTLPEAMKEAALDVDGRAIHG